MNVRTFLRTRLRQKGRALEPIAVAQDSQVMCAQGSSTVLTGVKKQILHSSFGVPLILNLHFFK